MPIDWAFVQFRRVHCNRHYNQRHHQSRNLCCAHHNAITCSVVIVHFPCTNHEAKTNAYQHLCVSDPYLLVTALSFVALLLPL